MKKILRKLCLVLIAAIIFIGCDIPSLKQKFHPPDWIEGTWTDENNIMIWTFEPENVILQSNSYSVDFSEMCKPSSVMVDESISNSYYSFTVETYEYEDIGGTYEFALTSSTTIDYSITVSGFTIGPITLILE